MNALQAYVRISWACGTPFVLLLDRRYTPRSKDEMRDAVAQFKKGPYVPELFDCDDFAAALKGQLGHAVGIAMNHKHAWNVALCTDGVWHIEPQTGEFRKRKWTLFVMI